MALASLVLPTRGAELPRYPAHLFLCVGVPEAPRVTAKQQLSKTTCGEEDRTPRKETTLHFACARGSHRLHTKEASQDAPSKQTQVLVGGDLEQDAGKAILPSSASHARNCKQTALHMHTCAAPQLMALATSQPYSGWTLVLLGAG